MTGPQDKSQGRALRKDTVVGCRPRKGVRGKNLNNGVQLKAMKRAAQGWGTEVELYLAHTKPEAGSPGGRVPT